MTNRLILAAIVCLSLISVRAQAPGLQIVVIAGEDAVNVVQQRTAVAPVIEVRDRNNQPVAGAVVRFAVTRGRATFNGARALSVTTNAAGRAAAGGLTPIGSGALQISATATFQGQTAAVTIAQTNVMTAAAASGATASGTGAGAGTSAGAAGGGGTAAGGAAGAGAGVTAGAGSAAASAGGAAAGAGGGLGLSATTIAVIGGAATGGAIAAKEVLGGPVDSDVYTGTYSGNISVAFSPSRAFCSRTMAHNGTVEIDIAVNGDGTVSGVGTAKGEMALVSFSGGNVCAIKSGTQPYSNGGPMTGTKTAMAFNASNPGAAGVTVTYEFTGALQGDTIVGTFIFTLSEADSVDRGVFPVTLQKQ